MGRSSPESLLLTGLLFAGYGAFVLGRFWRDLRGAQRSERFVAMRGRLRGVHRAALPLPSRSGSIVAPRRSLRLSVSYEYEVDGVVRIGTRYAYGRVGRTEWIAARALCDAGERERAIEVWYDPLRPEDAVLQRGFIGNVMRELAYGLGAVAFGALLIVPALRRLTSGS